MDAAAVARPIVGMVGDVAAIADDAVRLNPFALPPLVLEDVTVAASRADETIGRVESMIAQYGSGILDDVQLAATKDSRIGAHRINLEAQGRLTKYIDDSSLLDEAAGSKVRQADANLEDANWQLAKKPSPDGRFNGVDLAGSLRDTRTASDILRQLAPLPSAADGVAPAAVAAVA